MKSQKRFFLDVSLPYLNFITDKYFEVLCKDINQIS